VEIAVPDPFLEQSDFDTEFQGCVRAAKFHGVRVWKQERFVFLQCQGAQGETFLGRIDCHGYPAELPDVTFLDPDTKQPTVDRKLWPRCLSPMKGPGGLGLCLAGTKTYAMHHPNQPARHSICTLLEVLILGCRGRIAIVHGIQRR
jgi:hypothetical protein